MLYSNFREGFWYTPQSQREELLTPARFFIKPLPYKIFSLLNDHQELGQGLSRDNTYERILDIAIVDYDNIINPTDSNWWGILPEDLRNELIATILESSMPSADFLNKLDINIELTINKRFQDESWDCAKCQSRNMHYQRNCPYLPSEEHEDTFSIRVLDNVYRVCPMSIKDQQLIRSAFEAKNLRDMHGLPLEGSIGEQSIFFVVVSQRLIAAIEREKARQQEEAYASKR